MAESSRVIPARVNTLIADVPLGLIGARYKEMIDLHDLELDDWILPMCPLMT